MFLVHIIGGGSPSNLSGDAKKLRKLKGAIPIDFLINLWLGHKKVMKSNFFMRLFYSDSFDKNFLLELAKRFALEYGNSTYGIEYVFGPHANVIIPALIEMGIFEDVVTQLLKEERKNSYERRKIVAEFISKHEVDIAAYCNDKNLFKVFFFLRKEFCESAS